MKTTFTVPYKECFRCRKAMDGIMDYSIRTVCSKCDGKSINKTKEKHDNRNKNH